MSEIETTFRKQLIQILLRTGNYTESQLNDMVWKIAGVLKNYKETSYLNVWTGNSRIKNEVDRILNEYSINVTKIIERQIQDVFEITDEKNDLLVKAMLVGVIGTKATVSKLHSIFNRTLPEGIDPKLKIEVTVNSIDQILSTPRNTTALDAFLNRKVNGLELSKRVWNLTNETVKPLIESQLALGIEKGTSAVKISQELRQYLNNPDSLFRRVRDSKGKLKLSAAAKDFHPGQGTYRSSYKNAARLSREETNQAYRRADFERWNNDPTVVGVNVQPSAQHRIVDVCDSLKGIYPKEFLFPGWHVQCMCMATSILINQEEFEKYLTGAPVEVDYVAEVPENFNNWVEANKTRIEGWKSKPYFLTENQSFINKSLTI